MFRNNFKIFILLIVLFLVTACSQKEVTPKTNIPEQPIPDKISETNQKDFISGSEFPNDKDFDVRDYNFHIIRKKTL